MTNDAFVFPARPIPAAPVKGSALRYPIGRIFCVGRNYAEHAREMGTEPDKEDPFYFTKSAHAYVPSGSTIPYPPETANCHYEMELVAAIGAVGFRVAEEDALSIVYGYAAGIDLTRRDRQQDGKDKRRPWDLGKDFENAAILSEIVPAADIGHPESGAIELSVNGEMRQRADIADMINSVAEVIAHLSRFYHLAPGDLIYTGTPAGVGPIVAGDRIEGQVEGIAEISVIFSAAE
ncbi:MAG: fumarylacetoacetase [Hyphomicrobiales bacterium]|nr:MAG: fumarylacetoacetase [Hyphomicrobiales bacterium]